MAEKKPLPWYSRETFDQKVSISETIKKIGFIHILNGEEKDGTALSTSPENEKGIS